MKLLGNVNKVLDALSGKNQLLIFVICVFTFCSVGLYRTCFK